LSGVNAGRAAAAAAHGRGMVCSGMFSASGPSQPGLL